MKRARFAPRGPKFRGGLNMAILRCDRCGGLCGDVTPRLAAATGVRHYKCGSCGQAYAQSFRNDEEVKMPKRRARFYVAPIDNSHSLGPECKARTWGVFDRSRMQYGGEGHNCVADVDQRSTARHTAAEYNALDAFFVGLARLSSP